jgi:hypothetical protein
MYFSVWLSNRLKIGDTDIVVKTLLTFRKDLPPPAECLRIIALLLITDNAEIRRSAGMVITYCSVHTAVPIC